MSSPACLAAVLAVILSLGSVLTAKADVPSTNPPLWKPVADDVYLQESGQKVATDSPVTSLGLFHDTLHALVDGKVYVLENGELSLAEGAPADTYRLQALDGALWAMSESGLYRFSGDAWNRVDEQRFVDMCMHLGSLHAATADDVFCYREGRFASIKPETGYLSSDITVIMEDGTQVLSDPVQLGPIRQIASYHDTLYILRPDRLVLLDGPIVEVRTIDWGTVLSRNWRDMLADGSRLYITTDRGVAEIRGMALAMIQGKDGLPYEDTTCLAPGFGGDLWIGTTKGAIRKVGNEYHYFAADLWLPGDNVHDIAAGDRVVYVATDAGIGVIRYEPYTLLKKAAYYERHMQEWGHKRLGFIHSLYWSDKEQGWIREISDNDGGHTSPYLAAMSFKYAVTGDKKAREEALDAFKAMVWLEEIAPEPGFFARAIWSTTADQDEKHRHGSGGLPAKWYPTADGLWYWKGDTSSDEAIAHFYSVSIFHDLAAKGPEKTRAAEHLGRIAKHIIDNGWVLRDMDGQPTRWGRWDPKYLTGPYGGTDRGLNALEAQAFMQAAYALTQDPVFEEGLQQLIKWGYHRYTIRQKNTFPPDAVVTWDDGLAFEAYYPLLRYTGDPYLRSVYLRSLGRTWEVKRFERVAWYNFIYGAMTGNDCEAGEAAQYLREFPLDLVSHRYANSYRADLAPPPGYVPYVGATRAISPREIAAQRGSRSALQYDGGSGGRTVVDPGCWLMDYWMGRYHGFISAPAVKNPELTSVKPSPGGPFGAKPYSGPGRPEGLIPGE